MSCRELTRLCCRINLCVKERSGSTNSVLQGNFLAFLLCQPCSLFHGLLSLSRGWFWRLGALSFHYLPNCLTFCPFAFLRERISRKAGFAPCDFAHCWRVCFLRSILHVVLLAVPWPASPAVHCLVSVLVRLSPRLEYDGGCASLARVMVSSTRSS